MPNWATVAVAVAANLPVSAVVAHWTAGRKTRREERAKEYEKARRELRDVKEIVKTSVAAAYRRVAIHSEPTDIPGIYEEAYRQAAQLVRLGNRIGFFRRRRINKVSLKLYGPSITRLASNIPMLPEGSTVGRKLILSILLDAQESMEDARGTRRELAIGATVAAGITLNAGAFLKFWKLYLHREPIGSGVRIADDLGRDVTAWADESEIKKARDDVLRLLDKLPR